MRTARGTCNGAPGARQGNRRAIRCAVALFFVFLLAACGANNYRVPWEVSASGPVRHMGPPPHTVVVQRGDTVYGVSRRYGVPMKDIIQANRLAPPYDLQVGQTLVMPRPRAHVVRRGDTLFAIARAYQVDMNAMARVNRLTPPYLIQVGQHLLVPDQHYIAVAGTPPRPASRPQVTAAAAPQPVAKPAPPAAARPAAASAAARPGPVTKPVAAPPTVAARPVAAPPPPPPPSRTTSTFAWPVSGKIVSRFGGKADGSRNDGINIAAPRGAPVKAAENGVVVYSGNELKGFGNLLLIKHADGWMTAYAHNELLTVKKGETVRRGQTIGRVGTSGNVSAPQLHFEIRRGSKAVDPIKHLSRQMASAE